jgi:hypothetical protein
MLINMDNLRLLKRNTVLAFFLVVAINQICPREFGLQKYNIFLYVFQILKKFLYLCKNLSYEKIFTVTGSFAGL